MKNKKRLDIILVEKGYFKSRSKASSYISTGRIFINNTRQDKPGKLFSPDEIKNVKIYEPEKYVSRGGYKLEKALNTFNIKLLGKVALDIGASTGGFTDCLLQYGVKKVYAVDVGYGQLDLKLRNDPRVILCEKTNIRYIDEKTFYEKIDIVTVDVSFISVKKFLHILIPYLNSDFDIIVLIKPQFEAEKKEVKKGVVRDKSVHIKVLQRFLEYINSIKLKIVNLTYSPIKGPKGNIEFLSHIKDNGESIKIDDIVNIVEESEKLKTGSPHFKLN